MAQKAGLEKLHAAFPDLEYTIEDIFSEGNKVVARCKGAGTHLGPFRDIPATGKKMNYTVILIWLFSDGKLIEHWSVSDVYGMLQQLEVIQVKS
jgi:predicted ester cyclase